MHRQLLVILYNYAYIYDYTTIHVCIHVYDGCCYCCILVGYLYYRCSNCLLLQG